MFGLRPASLVENLLKHLLNVQPRLHCVVLTIACAIAASVVSNITNTVSCVKHQSCLANQDSLVISGCHLSAFQEDF